MLKLGRLKRVEQGDCCLSHLKRKGRAGGGGGKVQCVRVLVVQQKDLNSHL